jgi:GNAT superfamily N-acetyltransferase
MVVIRDADAADAAALAPLAEAAVRATYSPIAQAAVYEAVIAQSCTAEALAASISLAGETPDDYFLVAVEDDSLVGFLDFGGQPGEKELRRLYTAVGYTSRGIGATLLAALEGLLPPGSEYSAIVHAVNKRGLDFWLRHGFVSIKEVDTREHFTVQRGLSFDRESAREPSLLLHRRVDG